jgi:hypothetical protein
MYIEKLKQTLNYIQNVTEEDVIYDASTSALSHLSKVEVEMQNIKSSSSYSIVYSPVNANGNDFESRFAKLKSINLNNCDWDELSDARAKAQDLWDELDTYINKLNTLADDVSSLEGEIENEMDGRDGDGSDDEEDFESDDFQDQLD